MQAANKEVRALLRSLRRPRAAESEKLGLMLQKAYGTPTARDAVIAVIDEAFSDRSHAARLGRETIERCDIRGESTKMAAHTLGISVRSLFRYRVDAIAAISTVVDRALKRSFDPPHYELALARLIANQQPEVALDIYLHGGLPHDGQIAYDIVKATVWAGLEVSPGQLARCAGPWRALALAEIGRNYMAQGRLDRWRQIRAELVAILEQRVDDEFAAAAFELVSLDRIDARRQCDIVSGRELSARMRALAGRDHDRLASALIAQAEQSIAEGSTTAAALHVAEAERMAAVGASQAPIARCALVQAAIAFSYERYDRAIAFASAAAAVLSGVEAGFTARAHALAGRAAYLGGIPWRDNVTLPDRYSRVWTAAELSAVRARHLLDRDLPRAKALASEAIDLAIDQDAKGALAYAHATLAEVFRREAKSSEADAMSQDAWNAAVSLGDHSYLFDMFVIRNPSRTDTAPWFTREPFIRSLAELIHEQLERPLPRWPELGPCIASLIKSSLEAGLGRSANAGEAVEALSKLRYSRRVFADFADAGAQKVIEFLPYLVAPDVRQSFRERFQTRWQSIVWPVTEASSDLATDRA